MASGTHPGIGSFEHEPASVLDAARRIAGVEEILGATGPEVLRFPDAIRRHTRRQWGLHVAPRFRTEWPEAADGPVAAKLRYLACDLYGSGPYALLPLSRRLPARALALLRGADFLCLGPAGLDRAAARGVALLARAIPAEVHRRVILVGAYTATVDAAFDLCLAHLAPEDRELRIRGTLTGSPEPDHGSLRLARALHTALDEGISCDERAAWDAARAGVVRWCEAEVAALTGIPDPAGLDHRLAGALGTADGLLFAMRGFAGEDARTWMHDATTFVQMLDDWIDYEIDRRGPRSTPVLTGRWTLGTLRRQWERSVRSLEGLAAAAGPHGRRFLRAAYGAMMRDVMRAMIDGVAA